ncbi:hypothetical protein B0H14DRAFT_2607967 [Mycena olivaceomarginata]|nr:hypothetical protein B0H14DRAFT_2607967 [Mycena olivaceomarginata]
MSSANAAPHCRTLSLLALRLWMADSSSSICQNVHSCGSAKSSGVHKGQTPFGRAQHLSLSNTHPFRGPSFRRFRGTSDSKAMDPEHWPLAVRTWLASKLSKKFQSVVPLWEFSRLVVTSGIAKQLNDEDGYDSVNDNKFSVVLEPLALKLGVNIIHSEYRRKDSHSKTEFIFGMFGNHSSLEKGEKSKNNASGSLHGIVVVTAHNSAADPHILVLEQRDPDIPIEPHTPTVSAYFDNVNEVEHPSPQMLSSTMKNPTSELLSFLLLGFVALIPNHTFRYIALALSLALVCSTHLKSTRTQLATSQHSSINSRKISGARWYTSPEAIPALRNRCGAFTRYYSPTQQGRQKGLID